MGTLVDSSLECEMRQACAAPRPLIEHVPACPRTPMLFVADDAPTIGSVTAGMLGLMGNKGGVGVRFRVHDSSVCFVSSHLAAHRENVRARNDNFVKVK